MTGLERYINQLLPLLGAMRNRPRSAARGRRRAVATPLRGDEEPDARPQWTSSGAVLLPLLGAMRNFRRSGRWGMTRAVATPLRGDEEPGWRLLSVAAARGCYPS